MIQPYQSPFQINAGQQLMFITHPNEKYDEIEQVKMVLEAGCRWIQVRMKENPDPEKANQIIQLCRQAGEDVICCINDYPELAIHSGANALHLGKNNLPVKDAWALVRQEKKDHFIIGATANTFEDIRNAAMQKASYIGLGPYRFTSTKKNLSPVLGIKGYDKIIHQCKEAAIQMPIFAIGGILLSDVIPLLETGVSGIVISSAIICANDPVKMTKQFLYELNKYKK